MQGAHDPPYGIHPQTSATIDLVYAERTMDTFGWCGADGFL